MSKGLEALERLISKYNEMCRDTGCNDDEYQNGNNTSERAVIEQELKALEIIKNKKVWVTALLSVRSVDEYNKPYSDKFTLTKDEFDLLKEVLK